MNENNKNGVSPIVEFVDTTKNKDLQKRIVEILKEMTFKGKFRFYVGISRNFLVILVGIVSYFDFHIKVGSIDLPSDVTLLKMTDSQIRILIKVSVKDLLKGYFTELKIEYKNLSKILAKELEKIEEIKPFL